MSTKMLTACRFIEEEEQKKKCRNELVRCVANLHAQIGMYFDGMLIIRKGKTRKAEIRR